MALNSYLWNFIQSPVGYSFDIEKACIDKDRPIEEQLHEVFHSMKETYADDEELIAYIDRIKEDSELIYIQAVLFDFDEQTQGNGYWTLLIIMIKFGRILSDPDLKKKIGRLPLLHLMQIMTEGLKVGLQLHTPKLESLKSNDSNEKINLSLFTDEMDFEGILDLIQSLKVPMTSFYEHFNFCWVRTFCFELLRLFYFCFIAWHNVQSNATVYEFYGHLFNSMEII